MAAAIESGTDARVRATAADPQPTGKEVRSSGRSRRGSCGFTCDRGKDRMVSETHFKRGDMLIRDIITRMRHDGCGGRAGGGGVAHRH